MLFLTKIFAIVTFTFATFTSAVPAPTDDIVHQSTSINSAKNCGSGSLLPSCAIYPNNINPRHSLRATPDISLLKAIISDLQTDLKADIDQLAAIKSETCTVQVVKLIVDSLCGKIGAAAHKISPILSKYTINELLEDKEGLAWVTTLTHLLIDLFFPILAAVGSVLRIADAGGAKGNEVKVLFVPLGAVLVGFFRPLVSFMQPATLVPLVDSLLGPLSNFAMGMLL